ncbi:hypothetical protein BDR07DRAFT_1492016 [Suillus spraguei]|nr:hypothetical protein BDR07DRAFT_1492016 [Suillus spraguei]
MPTPSLIPQSADSILAMDSANISKGAAGIMSISLEGILYGFSIFMFLGTIYALTHNRHIRTISYPSLVVALLLLILSTAHIVINIIRTGDGLVKYRDTFPGGPDEYFDDVSQVTYLAKDVLYIMQTLLADGVLIYRCYVVWQSTWIIILPCMLWCSVLVTGICATYISSQVKNNFFGEELAPWVEACLVSTIVSNSLSSGLLAYRIWVIERNVSTVRATKSTTMPILRALVDSTVLYSAFLFSALICFLCSNVGVIVVVDMAMPLMSITFYMVLIRIAINRNRPFSAIPRTTSETDQGNPSHYHMEPLQFHVSKISHNDGTSVYGTGTKDRPSIYKANSEQENVVGPNFT